VRVHVATDFILKDSYIDPAKWSPRIYNFRHYWELADKELGKTFGQKRRRFGNWGSAKVISELKYAWA
jgi:hypothetical protein